MTDWQPTSLTPSNGDWDHVNRLQLILHADPFHFGSLAEWLESGEEAQPALTIQAAGQASWGGLLGAPSLVDMQAHAVAHATQYGHGVAGAGSGLDLQQGLVDFVRYVLPASDFNPESASEAFQLGELLLDLFAKLLTFPGGAMLAYSVLTSLNREVPELGAYLNQESDLSLFEAVDSRLGKLIRRLLEGIDQVPVASPGWVQNVEAWIHTVNANYRNLEASGIFEEPDFLSRLFRRASSQIEVSCYPGEKAGWAGVVFYVLGLIFEGSQPEIAEQLFESSDLFFELSSLLNLDTFGSIDDVPLGPLERFFAVVDGVQGVFDYGHAVSDLFNPSLDPYISGDGVWPRRISVMLSGIEGILSTGSAIVSLSGIEAIAAFAPPLAAGIFICFLISWVIDNWDWISVGLQAWKKSWIMLTQIVIPFRVYQGWQWFDDNLGRPVRENILHPLGQWANTTLNGVTGFFQGLAGD